MMTVILVVAATGCATEDPWPPGAVDPEGTHYQYVFNEMMIPTTYNEAAAYGLDLDHDGMGRLDNSGGRCLAMDFVGDRSFGAFAQERMGPQVRQGDIILLADLQATSLETADGVGAQVLLGSSPSPSPCIDAMDEVCGRHLDGSGGFLIDEQSAEDSLVTGSITDGQLMSDSHQAMGGDLPPASDSLVILLPLYGGAPAIAIEIHGARIEIDTVTPSGLVGGKLGGGIVADDFDARIVPALHAELAAHIANDCTGEPSGCPGSSCRPCGCEDDLDLGRIMLDLFDEYGATLDDDPDCAVTPEEFRSNSLLSSLVAPDLDLFDCRNASNPPGDCVFAPGTDEIKDSLSFGMGFNAVKASFPLPPLHSGE